MAGVVRSRLVVGRCRVTLLLLGLLLTAVAGSRGASAEEATVTVTAAVSARTVARFSDATVSFDPTMSTASLSTYPGPDGTRYHVWKGSGSGAPAEVLSNVPWTGTLSADPADAASAAALSAGALRYALAEPRSFEDCESAAPLRTSPVAWTADHPRGRSEFSFYYCFRVEAGESPADFSAALVLAVSPSRPPAEPAGQYGD